MIKDRSAIRDSVAYNPRALRLSRVQQFAARPWTCSAITLRIKHAFEKGHWRILQITLESGWLEARVSSQWDQGDDRATPRATGGSGSRAGGGFAGAACCKAWRYGCSIIDSISSGAWRKPMSAAGGWCLDVRMSGWLHRRRRTGRRIVDAPTAACISAISRRTKAPRPRLTRPRVWKQGSCISLWRLGAHMAF